MPGASGCCLAEPCDYAKRHLVVAPVRPVVSAAMTVQTRGARWYRPKGCRREKGTIRVQLPASPRPAPVVLLLLAESDGYELSERLRDFGLDSDGPGSVYAEVPNLQSERLAESELGIPAGAPPPRVYPSHQPEAKRSTRVPRLCTSSWPCCEGTSDATRRFASARHRRGRPG